MDKGVFSLWRRKDLAAVCLIMVVLLLDCPPLGSSLGDEGKALMAIKASFSNWANVLLDWNDAEDGDFCAWRGVLCDNISHSVASLNLSNLNLGGEISVAIGDLRNLLSIDLQGNKLTGQIPYEIGSCRFLVHLDLSSNNFTGHIPASVGDLEHLLTLNLSKNLLGGVLPAEFGNLRNIQIIDMSYNILSGRIPPEFGQLQNLMQLILNDNNLLGKIPNQLTNCFSLVVLNVSFNNLCGVIPLMNNFSRFSSDSFVGNPKLCGNFPASCCGSYPKSRAIFSPTAVVCITIGFIVLLVIVGRSISSNFPPPMFEPEKNSFDDDDEQWFVRFGEVISKNTL